MDHHHYLIGGKSLCHRLGLYNGVGCCLVTNTCGATPSVRTPPEWAGETKVGLYAGDVRSMRDVWQRLAELKYFSSPPSEVLAASERLAWGSYAEVFSLGVSRVVKVTPIKQAGSVFDELEAYRKLRAGLEKRFGRELAERMKRLFCVPLATHATKTHFYLVFERFHIGLEAQFGVYNNPEKHADLSLRVDDLALPLLRVTLFANRSCKVLHRDVKPENIGIWDLTKSRSMTQLLESKRVQRFFGVGEGCRYLPVLIDWGSSTDMQSTRRGATTETYAAPECFVDGAPEHGVDLFGVGAALWAAKFCISFGKIDKKDLEDRSRMQRRMLAQHRGRVHPERNPAPVWLPLEGDAERGWDYSWSSSPQVQQLRDIVEGCLQLDPAIRTRRALEIAGDPEQLDETDLI